MCGGREGRRHDSGGDDDDDDDDSISDISCEAGCVQEKCSVNKRPSC